MISKYINFGNGIIIKDDFIDITEPLISQQDNLYEDMVLVDYPNLSICLDIGWYGGDIIKGNFMILLIKNENWDEPIFRTRIQTIEGVIINVRAIQAFINILEQDNNRVLE